MSIHVVALAEWTGLETGDLKRTPGLLEAARWLIGAKKFYSSRTAGFSAGPDKIQMEKMTDS
ncbi:hypothetical protein Scep_006891 [Stephania cephalantha]|uniref:Uncharacterized protein n=1 Tax=Stephania cephalantha TaxID=152367 RepID=A0AAP0PMN6_9MAGN